MRTHRKPLGQTLIEFAILLPLILILVMGLFDIGRAIIFYAVLNSAVREGTRYAVVQSACDYLSDPGACDGVYLDSYPLNCTSATSTANINICDEIKSKFVNIGDLSKNTIMITHLPSGVDDQVISIDIEYLFEPITPVLSLMGNLTLHVNSQMLMTPIALP